MFLKRYVAEQMNFRFLASTLVLILSGFLFTKAQTTGASCPDAAQYYAKDSINVITFGASTVEGVKGTNFQTYLINNFTSCYQGKVVNVQNFGIGGETTMQGLLRIDQAIYGKTGFIVILMGANDAIQMEDGKQTLADTEASMRQIIVKSLNQRLAPIICTLQNFDDRGNRKLFRINSHVRLINNLYRKLALEYKIYLCDLNAVLKRDFSLYQDIIHPNARGNRLISFALFDTINKIIAERFLQFTVTQNYPNPFALQTKVDIVMPEADKIELKIYDIQGRVVKNVLNEYMNAGKHVIQMDLSNLPPGIYIYKVSSSSGTYRAVKKLILAAH